MCSDDAIEVGVVAITVFVMRSVVISHQTCHEAILLEYLLLN